MRPPRMRTAGTPSGWAAHEEARSPRKRCATEAPNPQPGQRSNPKSEGTHSVNRPSRYGPATARQARPAIQMNASSGRVRNRVVSVLIGVLTMRIGECFSHLADVLVEIRLNPYPSTPYLHYRLPQMLDPVLCFLPLLPVYLRPLFREQSLPTRITSAEHHVRSRRNLRSAVRRFAQADGHCPFDGQQRWRHCRIHEHPPGK